MKKVTLKDSKGNEINDIMKDVLTFDSETTGVPRKGAKWEFMSMKEIIIKHYGLKAMQLIESVL